MKQQYSKLLLVIFLLLSAPQAFAQLKGVITDSISHEPLMYISVFYEGKGVGGISNANGEYQVETRKGWNELTFSAVGYITKKVKIPAGAKELNVVLSPDDVMLEEVVVKPKKEKYSRKNNPAVEQQAGMIDPRREILNMAMEKQIELLNQKVAALSRENKELKRKNEKLQKALRKQDLNFIKNL